MKGEEELELVLLRRLFLSSSLLSQARLVLFLEREDNENEDSQRLLSFFVKHTLRRSDPLSETRQVRDRRRVGSALLLRSQVGTIHQ